jgi:soluble lytic murein transglycosylase-like protein
MSTIQERITAAAIRHGVPPNIALGVARAESNFQQSALSRCGAIGVMQLMPATAAALEVDPHDEDQNIEGGVRLLAENFARYKNWPYALAAYNAGPYQADKGPDEWPAETKAYVPKVLAYARMVPGPDPEPASGAAKVQAHGVGHRGKSRKA